MIKTNSAQVYLISEIVLILMAHECFCIRLINGYCCGTNAVLIMNYGFMYILFNLAEKKNGSKYIEFGEIFFLFFLLQIYKTLDFSEVCFVQFLASRKFSSAAIQFK